MALDTIAEIVVRVVGNFFLEVIVVKIFYWPGWLLLRIITFGHYPPSQKQPHNREFVGAIGLAATIVLLLFNIRGGGL